MTALTASIRRPRGMILTLGIVFVTVGAIVSLVTSGIGEAIRTATLFGVLSFAALLWTNAHQLPATDRHRPTHADENAEDSTHSTTTATEED